MSTKLRLPSGLQAVSVATLRSSPTADYVIFVSPWWNPAADDPASGRAHRIGQQRPVTVYWLVTQGSIEDRIVKLHRSKRALAEGVLACWRAGVLACWRAGGPGWWRWHGAGLGADAGLAAGEDADADIATAT